MLSAKMCLNPGYQTKPPHFRTFWPIFYDPVHIFKKQLPQSGPTWTSSSAWALACANLQFGPQSGYIFCKNRHIGSATNPTRPATNPPGHPTIWMFYLAKKLEFGVLCMFAVCVDVLWNVSGLTMLCGVPILIDPLQKVCAVSPLPVYAFLSSVPSPKMQFCAFAILLSIRNSSLNI